MILLLRGASSVWGVHGVRGVPRIPGVRHYAMNSERMKLLKEIYAPFAQLVPKSPEYTRLAVSGKCWHDYFDFGNMQRYGYIALGKVGFGISPSWLSLTRKHFKGAFESAPRD